MSKPTAGHRCLGVTRYVDVVCECGWRSEVVLQWRQALAYEQWRKHITQCNGAALHPEPETGEA